MTADFPGATWLPSSRYWQGHGTGAVRYVVIHGTAGGGSAQEVATWLNTNPSHIASVHYVIGKDGSVVQLVSEADSAWGNGPISAGAEYFWSVVSPYGNPNYCTISIEHCKDATDNSDELTPAQRSASFRLVRDICRRHNIPPRKADASGGIAGHCSMDPVERAHCPGPYPWDELFHYLTTHAPNDLGAQEDTMFAPGVPAGWSDNGQRLATPNTTAIIVHGFRDFILTHGWDPANTPVENEKSANPCDPTDTHSGPGSQQTFKDDILIWQQSTAKIYRAHCGAYALQLEHALAAQTAALAAAQAHVSTPPPAAEDTAKAVGAEVAKRRQLEASVKTAEAELTAAVAAAEA